MSKPYTLREKVFGPKLTDEEILAIELRAVTEGWYEVLEVLLDQAKNRRAKQFLLAYIRDGLIDIEVIEVNLSIEQYEDVYQDDDPFEVDR